MDEYYVYVYLDPRKKSDFKYDEYYFGFEPFYVGKGKKNRMLIHTQKINDTSYTKRNPIFYNRIKEILSENVNPIIIKIKENLFEEMALYIEKSIISSIGRIIKNNGPLLNITSGGNGFRGCNSYRGGFNKKHSDETKKKLSEYHKGKSFSDLVGEKKSLEWRNNISKSLKNKKSKISKEGIENIRNIWLNKKMPDEARKKMSEKRKGKSPWNKGKKIYQYTIDNKFVSELLLYEIPKLLNIPSSNIVKCCKGERKTAGGYIWKYIKE